MVGADTVQRMRTATAPYEVPARGDSPCTTGTLRVGGTCRRAPCARGAHGCPRSSIGAARAPAGSCPRGASSAGFEMIDNTLGLVTAGIGTGFHLESQWSIPATSYAVFGSRFCRSAYRSAKRLGPARTRNESTASQPAQSRRPLRKHGGHQLHVPRRALENAGVVDYFIGLSRSRA